MESNVLLASVIYFNKDNAKFYKTQNGFVALKAFIPPVELFEEDFALDIKRFRNKKQLFDIDAERKWQDLGRVYFHRAFPFDLPDKYISVLDRDSNEYGIIKDLNDFDVDTVEMITDALARKYYMPVIQKITDIKEQFGYSYWSVLIDGEKRNFSVRDTFKSIIKISETKLLIMDADGNRFLIPDINELDSKSGRKIEVYL